MNPRFETINGNICMMLEKPIPLTKDAKFPCVVRLIQDDSPMGRYNNRLTDKCLLPFICVGIDNNGDMERMENAPRFSHECYELLGYPVAEGSAEWAVWQMMQGKQIVLGNGSVKHSHIRYMKNHAVFCTSCGQLTLDINDWLLSAEKSGWQLYEPKPEPITKSYVCPVCNETIIAEQERLGHDRYDNDLCSNLLSARVGDHMRSSHDTCDAQNPESATQADLSIADATQKPLLADAQKGWTAETRNGEHVQLTDIVETPIIDRNYLFSDGMSRYIDGYRSKHQHKSPCDIIHTEPLAPDGSAEWYRQMMLIGKKLTNTRWKTTKNLKYTFVENGIVKCNPEYKDNTEYHVSEILSPHTLKDGWQIYTEPKPLLELCKVCKGTGKVYSCTKKSGKAGDKSGSYTISYTYDAVDCPACQATNH